jgi:hypothetical protein
VVGRSTRYGRLRGVPNHTVHISILVTAIRIRDSTFQEVEVRELSLPGLSAKRVASMTASQRTEYFEKYGRCLPSPVGHIYAIRVGKKRMFSDDTMELRQMFTQHLHTLQRVG